LATAAKPSWAGLTVTVVVAATGVDPFEAANWKVSTVALATLGARKLTVLPVAPVRVTAGPPVWVHDTALALLVPVSVTTRPAVVVAAAPALTVGAGSLAAASLESQAARTEPPSVAATIAEPPPRSVWRRERRCAASSFSVTVSVRLVSVSPSV
jgi:hypothetical protein